MNIKDFTFSIGISTDYLLNISRNRYKLYNTYYIKKPHSSKKRVIDSPNRELKGIQRWILDYILSEINIPDCIHGFVKGRGIKSNALKHINNKYILCLDIKDFFPSISQKRIKLLFDSFGFDTDLSSLLSRLCTYNERLPQGAVTSPALSNHIFKNADNEIIEYCQKHFINYTRYADDLTFSSNNRSQLLILENVISRIVRRNGFTLNSDKSRLMSPQGRLVVTGLLLNSSLINKKLSIGRNKKRILRSAIHNILIKKREIMPINKATGLLCFLNDIEPETYNKFRTYISLLKNKGS